MNEKIRSLQPTDTRFGFESQLAQAMAQLRNTLTIGPLRIRANPSATDAREELLAVKIYAATALAQRLSKSCQLRTLPTKPATTQNAAPS